MTKIETLYEKIEAAGIAVRILKHAIEAARREEIRRAEDEFDSACLPLKSKLKDLEMEERAIQEEIDRAVEAESREKDNAPFPIGTKLYEWKKGRWHFDKYKKTGQVGVVDVWGVDTKFPENMRFHPLVGRYFIRILKNDGTESLKFAEFGSYRSLWFPEGQEPKQPEEK